ncbi:uncharacterized protein LOC62_05G007622 [Vanrija pseudolonga]|uniref:Uncharacterized protein n=1 Tax=Vanrija pseudolonga TaxID=143232 RepID=A0AAF0YCC3_9TREE|nr:hypothetical protein LOC62_05G007622 [Vanrija pseudolonga]
MWPRYAEFEVGVVQQDARHGWVAAGSGLVHGGNVGDAVITRASHVRRAFDSEYARTSPTFRLDVLRQYMYVKYRRSRVHTGPGAESKLAPLQATVRLWLFFSDARSDPCAPRPLADRLASFTSARRELDDWLDQVAASAETDKDAVRL